MDRDLTIDDETARKGNTPHFIVDSRSDHWSETDAPATHSLTSAAKTGRSRRAWQPTIMDVRSASDEDRSTLSTVSDIGRDINSENIAARSVSNLTNVPHPSNTSDTGSDRQGSKRRTKRSDFASCSRSKASGKEKAHACQYCEMKFASKYDLKRHEMTHTGEKPHSCPFCEKRFIQSGQLNEHVRRHTGEKPFTCTQCNKKFSTRKEVRMHELSHTIEKPYECQHCDKRYMQLRTLNVHMRKHTGEKMLSCDHCDKVFLSRNGLARHVMSHKVTQSEQFDQHLTTHCNQTSQTNLGDSNPQHSRHQCVKRLKQSSSDTLELASKVTQEDSSSTSNNTMSKSDDLNDLPCKVDSTANRYDCENCPSRYSVSSQLQQHSLTHDVKPEYECEKCRTRFTDYGQLLWHMVHGHNQDNHTSQPPLKQEPVDSDAETTCNMQTTAVAHNATSSSDVNPVLKRYVCENCPSRYSVSSQLQQHSLTHDVKTAYECEECRTRFTDYGQLLWHMFAHAQENHGHQLPVFHSAY